MTQLLELPRGRNSLIAAYEVVEQGGKGAERENVAATYEKYFATAVPPVSVKPHAFDKVSLVDPSIRTVIRSSTAAL